MKNFNDLSNQELSELNETQVSAYIDVELAKQNITKPTNRKNDFPVFVKEENAPERDAVIYCVNDLCFSDAEEAQQLVTFLRGKNLYRSDYDWNTGSQYKYVNKHEKQFNVSTEDLYSKKKYESIKGLLQAIEENKKKKASEEKDEFADIVDYEAYDLAVAEVKRKVREAIIYIGKIKEIALEYKKYLSITDVEEKAIQTLFTVYNVTDEKMQKEIKNQIASNKVEPENG